MAGSFFCSSEGVSQRHRHPLLRPGADVQRLGEGGGVHHAGRACVHAVVHPHAQGDAGGVGGAPDHGWKPDRDAQGLGQIHDVAGDHLTVEQPLITCGGGGGRQVCQTEGGVATPLICLDAESSSAGGDAPGGVR